MSGKKTVSFSMEYETWEQATRMAKAMGFSSLSAGACWWAHGMARQLVLEQESAMNCQNLRLKLLASQEQAAQEAKKTKLEGV